MIPVAVVVAQSNRKELTEQCLRSLNYGTFVDYKLFTKDGMKDGEMKTVNSLVESIDYTWKYLVRSDDDMFFRPHWLRAMLNVMKKNPDVWLLGGSRYPLHEVLEVRKDILVMEVVAANCWLIPYSTWEKIGPFYEDFIEGNSEDRRYCKAIQEAGGTVAALKNPLWAVHCGIKGTSGKGRSPYVEGYMQALADAVGAKTNK